MKHTRLYDIITNKSEDKIASLISTLWEEAENHGEFSDNAIKQCNLTRYEDMTFLESKVNRNGLRIMTILAYDAVVECGITGSKYKDIEIYFTKAD